MSCPNRYATRRKLPPNISSYPVARRVLSQAVRNTWDRLQQVMQGSLSFQELEQANLTLAVWLYEAFTGQNPHFSCESEFNGRHLAQYLRECVGSDVAMLDPEVDIDDDDAFLFSVFAYFVSEIFAVLKSAEAARFGLDQNPQVESFVDMWSLRLTGAPAASDFYK